jgi:uncharacterized protein
MKKHFFLKGSQKLKIYCEIEGNSKSKIAFISFHGLFDSSGNPTIRKVKDALAKAGFLILSFDYVGHGKSQGDVNLFGLDPLLRDFKEIMKLPELYSKKIFFIGYSFGVYPAILVAKKHPPAGIILYNPASNMLEIAFNRETDKELSKYTSNHKKMNLFAKILLFFEFLRHDIYKVSSKLNCPVFAFHSISDELVPYTQTKKLEANVKSKKLFVFLEGENHTCNKTDLLEKRIIPETLKWIKSV